MDFGVSRFSFKDISTDINTYKIYPRFILANRIFLLIVIMPFAYCLLKILANQKIKEGLLIIAGTLVFEILYNFWTNTLTARGIYVRIVKGAAIYLGSILFVLFILPLSFQLFSFLYLIAALVTVIYLISPDIEIAYLKDWARSWLTLRLPFMECLQIMYINLMTIIWLKMPVIVLSTLSTTEEIGYFSSAYTIVSALLLVPSSFSIPLLNRLAHNLLDQKALYQKYFQLILLFLTMGVLAGSLIFSAPRFIIETLYGDNFSKASVMLQCLSLLLLFSFPNYFSSNFFIITGFTKYLAKIKTVNVLIYLCLSYYLAFKYSIYGLMLSVILCEGVQFILYNFFVWKKRNEL
ncbi:MAG: hypothetical protein GX451_01620 [Acholeplasmataceae bacterium]|nr:hypothetical protein [Acholeplasmataceae bacterium]